MTSFFKRLLVLAVLGFAMMGLPSTATAGHSPYWHNHWGWYDNTYRPYYHGYYGPSYYGPAYGAYYTRPYYYNGYYGVPSPYYGVPGPHYVAPGVGVHVGRLNFGWW
jgi:hypothetical protein